MYIAYSEDTPGEAIDAIERTRPKVSPYGSVSLQTAIGLRPFVSGVLVRKSKRRKVVLEKKLQDLLQVILRDDLEVEPQYYITDVRTLEEAGVPSEERGLVVTMFDGSEFQITISRERALGYQNVTLAAPGTSSSSVPGTRSATWGLVRATKPSGSNGPKGRSVKGPTLRRRF